MAVTVSLSFADNPSRTLAVTKDFGDGSAKPVYGRDLRNNPALALSSGTANNAKGGADLAYHTILTVPVGAPVTLDLQAITDVAERTTRSFARVKYMEFWLLGGDDTTSLSGNACTGATVGAGATNGFLPFLADPTDKHTLGNGGFARLGDRTAAGLTVDGTHKTLTFTDLDGAVDAHVMVTIVGGSS
jgi:hypothetical protein